MHNCDGEHTYIRNEDSHLFKGDSKDVQSRIDTSLHTCHTNSTHMLTVQLFGENV